MAKTDSELYNEMVLIANEIQSEATRISTNPAIRVCLQDTMLRLTSNLHSVAQESLARRRSQEKALWDAREAEAKSRLSLNRPQLS